MKTALLLTALSATATTLSQAQQTPPPAPCAGVDYHQFDFWVGDWRVTTPDGELAGHNHIERTLGGCVVHESWTGAEGSKGESFNIYDRATAHWHQTWVDAHGLLLQLNGGLRDGAMVLEGERMSPDHVPVLHRVTWTPLDAQTVRQYWERSRDHGKTWEPVFDGKYVRTSNR